MPRHKIGICARCKRERPIEKPSLGICAGCRSAMKREEETLTSFMARLEKRIASSFQRHRRYLPPYEVDKND